MTVKTVKAENVTRGEAIAYGGTAEKPHPLEHATAYKRQDGAIIFATVKSGIFEHRNADRVRVSYDPAGDGAANLRWCRQCEQEHLRYVTAGKTGACYCRESVRSSAKRYRQTKRLDPRTAAEREAEREAQRAADRQARIDSKIEQLAAYRPKSRDELITVSLSGVARISGAESKRFANVARDYGLTVEQGWERIGHRAETVAAK